MSRKANFKSVLLFILAIAVIIALTLYFRK
jgi:hypothetical protein